MTSPFEDGDSSSLKHKTTFSESTPLLPSNTSYASSENSSYFAGSEDNSEDGPPELDSPKQKVNRKEAAAIMVSMFLLIFLQASNMSGMTMAQSTIAIDLDSYETAMWFTSSYLISAAAVTPLIGRLASIFSPRNMVLTASIFFSIGGVVTASAPSFSVFICGRVLSGVGGACIMTLSFILVLELTAKRRRGLFFGLINAGFTTGVSLGAVVFGALIPVPGWRALFWIQVPCGLLSGLGVYFSIPKSVNPGKASQYTSTLAKLKGIDYLGAFLLTTTLVLFLYGLSGSIEPIPIGVSLVTLVLFVLVEYNVAKDPVIPVAVLSNRSALLSCLSQLGFMAARWTILFYGPICALAVFGWHPGAAGAMLIPTNIGFGSGGLLAGALHIRRAGSFWSACLISLTFFGVTLFSLSFVANLDVPTPIFIMVIFLNGLCTGAALNYTLAHLLHLTHSETHYIATSLLATFRGFAGSFGSAIGGGIFARTLRHSLEVGFKTIDGVERLGKAREQLIKRLIGSPALVYGSGLSDMDREVAVQGYVVALRTLFRAAVVLTAFVLLIQAATGWKGPKDMPGDPEDEIAHGVEDHDREHQA